MLPSHLQHYNFLLFHSNQFLCTFSQLCIKIIKIIKDNSVIVLISYLFYYHVHFITQWSLVPNGSPTVKFLTNPSLLNISKSKILSPLVGSKTCPLKNESWMHSKNFSSFPVASFDSHLIPGKLKSPLPVWFHYLLLKLILLKLHPLVH